MTLTRDQILEASDLKTAVVDVPEWGGSVTVRTMTGADRDAFEQTLVITDGKGGQIRDISNLRVKLLAMTMVDDAGNLLFSESDIAPLAKKSAVALERVFKAANTLNGTDDAAEGEAVKNFDAAPNDGSISV
jgi:hypothetical protein